MRNTEENGQGDGAEAWDGGVSRSEGTGTLGREHRRGRAVEGRPGRWAAIVVRVDWKGCNKKRKRPAEVEG